MNAEDIYMIGIEPPDCEGGFEFDAESETTCTGKAESEVSIDLPMLGAQVAIGAYCAPCAAEVQRRLLESETFDLVWQREQEFSDRAFGTPSERGSLGPLKHLAKEAQEALDNPSDVTEYADCLMLVIDAARRQGFTKEQLLAAVLAKIATCEQREWPRSDGDANEAVEHRR